MTVSFGPQLLNFGEWVCGPVVGLSNGTLLTSHLFWNFFKKFKIHACVRVRWYCTFSTALEAATPISSLRVYGCTYPPISSLRVYGRARVCVRVV
jgi:hypothetical protein